MDLDALRFANFAQLDAAITDWEQMAGQLAQLEETSQRDLRAKAYKANWAGCNATVSREFIDKTAGEFSDAHTEATTVARILGDTRSELKDYQHQLLDAIERGLKNNLTVMDVGDGSFTVTMNVHPDRAGRGTTVPEHSRHDVDALRDEVQRILSKATESDTTASEALQLIVDQAKLGFSGAAYADRDSAAKAVKAAKTAAALMKKDPHKVTTTELNELNATLSQFQQDPLFAEQLATSVGPKGVLTFYAGIADPYLAGYDPKRGEAAKQFQKNLGITLGTATLSDSAKMDAWESGMVKLGSEPLGIDDAGNPRGFAVMSNLMRFGDYDDQFLNSYGDKLLAFDKERNVKGMSPWMNNLNQADLNFWGEQDRGRDPMTGFLEALGHNPDASTQFFAQPAGSGDTVDKDSEVNEHLQYLTKDRIWLPDGPVMGDAPDQIAGRDSLGHALEAATTGYAYDATTVPGNHPSPPPGSADRRTAATAGVMEQVAYLYGGEDGPKMLHDQPELADSLGKMGSAYIDDLDYAVSGLGDHAKDATTFPGRYAGRADFGNQGAITFLSVLGQNETSHGLVTAGQHLYTLSVLDANPPTSDANFHHGQHALVSEAEVRGILDHSHMQQAESDYKDDSEKLNKSNGRVAEWGKFAVGAAVGGGVALIPLPGTTVAGIAIAPVVSDLAGNALNTFIGQETDKAMDKAEDDPTEKSQMTSAEFFTKGEDDLGTSYEHYLQGHADSQARADNEYFKERIRETYEGTGPNENDHRGRAPYKD
ncbi:hypothetical protein ACGFW5_06715 [Streptomyces sp. NPDC048416]|uniref:hypothetical protein n=1 Tax=Streptomyces sp. NPDC048416 TaxID=3365546 RepID=UPI003711FE2B